MSNQENNSTGNTDKPEMQDFSSKDDNSSAKFAEEDANTSSSDATVKTKKTKSVLKDDDSQVEICRNFLQNRCTRGAFCKFRHCKPTSERNRSRSPISNRAQEKSSDDVCRDFLNNMCDRGKNCRYFHPPEDEIDKKPWFTLCFDFQNGKCTRHDCRFFHVSPEDEEEFRITGEVPMHILNQAMRRGIILEEQPPGSKPTCKDHLKGFCKITPCRFRHVNRREYQHNVYRTLRRELTALAGCDPAGREEYMGVPPIGECEIPALFSRNAEFRGPRHSGPYEAAPRERNDQFNHYPNDVPYNRPYDYDDKERLQHELRQLEDYLAQVQQEKDQRILSLEREISGFRFRGNGPFSGSMQLDLDRLRKKNEELTRDLKAKQSWEVIYNDTKAKLDGAMAENRQLSSELSALKSKMSAMASDLKSFEGYENYINDQGFRIHNQMSAIEEELSQPYAVNGSSIVLSQRDSWRQLHSMLAQVFKPNSRNMDGQGYGPSFGGSNLGPTYNNPSRNF